MKRLLWICCVCACSFDPKAGSGGVLCGTADECPSGLTCCEDNVCRTSCGAVPDGGADGACPDEDSDGVCDADDNCPGIANAGQYDCDGNGTGDACDPVLTAECLLLHGSVVSVGGTSTSATYTLRGAGGMVPAGQGENTSYRLRGGVTARQP